MSTWEEVLATVSSELTSAHPAEEGTKDLSFLQNFASKICSDTLASVLSIDRQTRDRFGITQAQELAEMETIR